MRGEITAAGGKYALRFSEGLIESVWRPGSVVDVEDARASILAVERLSGGTPAPLLVHLTDVQVSAAARRRLPCSDPASWTGSWRRPWAG
jgi:hypothetical protein